MRPTPILLTADRTCPCPGMPEDVARRASGGPASQIVISTYPRGHSNRLERVLPRRAEKRFGRPGAHPVSRFGLAAA